MTQNLILPINDMCFIVGYKAPIYKQEWGFTHYGIDCESVSGAREIRALGEGVVHSCGMDGATPKERMGNCIVIVYRDVQLPDGKVVNLACRMQHFETITCKAGQTVKAGDIIGRYGSTGKYSSSPHLHIEFDTDINYPASAYGVAAGGKVIKRGTVDSTIDPSTVWYIGARQSITAPADWVKAGYSAAKDTNLPRLPGGPEQDYKALYAAAKAEAEQCKARAEAAEKLLEKVRSLISA